MAKKDYKKIGFKCGLEIHQQLEDKKLFCACPTINSNAKPDIHLERRLRAVAGETGEIDIAAKYEMEKSKKFIYEADSKDTCLVEMDEEPPHPINPEAVQVALQVALMLKAKIVDEIQVMRKTVIDGSNVSGFQRTALIAYDGVIDTSQGKIHIPTICLEEEAAQKISDTKESTKYRLDRLGIPLIEIATAPDIKNPEHAKETAEKIGMILRSTGKVKRGIGTIRQDMNLSIKGRNRVELKGFQELKSIPAVLEKEVERQLALKKKEDGHVRKVEPDNTTSYLRPMPGAARMYPETDVIPLKVDTSKIKPAELIDTKVKKYIKQGLTPDLAKLIAKSPKVSLFEKFIIEFKNIKPAFIAETLVPTLREIKRKYNVDADKITDSQLKEVFSALNQAKIPKNIVMNILIDMASDKFESIDKYAGVSDKELEEEIKKIVKAKPGLSPGAYMGIVMARFKGQIDGKKAMAILKKIVK
ncbi:Glu-tRNA(Gln) amidotransferase subunit GatE [Candidatus Woesearchaeota archaeon]|nr:Glu-tRNA(Gln) amidotransferase subunit GatE [Candidatus Woesearchaeota archaeon]